MENLGEDFENYLNNLKPNFILVKVDDPISHIKEINSWSPRHLS